VSISNTRRPDGTVLVVVIVPAVIWMPIWMTCVGSHIAPAVAGTAVAVSIDVTFHELFVNVVESIHMPAEYV